MLNSLKDIAKEKKVEYTELIYDLIFVYMIGRNSALIHTTQGFVDAWAMFAYILGTLAVIQIWNFTTYYINQYGRNGLRDHIFLFINMYLLYHMGEGTSIHWEEHSAQYMISWALILVNIAVQYLIENRNHHGDRETRAVIRRSAYVLLAEAALVILSLIVYRSSGTLITFLPIAFGIAATFAFTFRARRGTVDFTHLSERAMLYVVLTFGEMIIMIAVYFEGELTAGSVYFSVMAFLIVAGLFMCYGSLYDHVIDREMETSGLGYMLVHVFLVFALNFITAALGFMREEGIYLVPKTALLIISFLMYFAFVMVLTGYAKAGAKPGKGFYLKMGLVSAVFVLMMIVFRNNMYVNIAVSAVYIYVVFFVIHGMGRMIQFLKHMTR